MSRLSLRWRLVLAGALAIFGAMLLAALLLSLLFQRHVEQWVEAELTVHLDQLIAGLGENAEGKLVLLRPPGDPRFGEPGSGLYWQVEIEPGGPVYRSRSLWDFQLALPGDGATSGSVREHRLPGPGGGALLVLERRVQLDEKHGAHTVQAAVAIDSGEIRAAVWRFASVLVPFLLLIGLLLGLAAWAQVTVGLRPLDALRRRLAAIRQGETDRLGADYPEEIRPLAEEIDGLLEARAAELDKARRRAADLAHGLKTPLQVLLSEAARLKSKGDDEISASIKSVAGDMQRHSERYLAQVRLAPLGGRARADIAKSVGTVRQVLERTPKGADLAWQEDVPQGLAAAMDEQDLAEALGNLMENAVRHAASRIEIRAASGEGDDAGKVIVSVADDGPGIPGEMIAAVRRPGARLDASGSGLGLAIAGDIAEASGGRLDLVNGEAGLIASLVLPAPPRPEPLRRTRPAR